MEDLQIKNDMHITRSIEEIYGTVLANERDRSGDIIQIAVEDDNFQKYLVLNSKLARQLFDFVNERLFVYGQIVDEDDGAGDGGAVYWGETDVAFGRHIFGTGSWP